MTATVSCSCSCGCSCGCRSTGELPEAWIPPEHILELRTRVRLRKTLIDLRTAWLQPLRAQLFHQGIAAGIRPRTLAGRQQLERLDLPSLSSAAGSGWATARSRC
jgi:hypothetical protein